MKRRSGFTLIELLVVITIIIILVALLLPAINQARLAALKAQCASNMRQIAIAANTHETAQGSYPPGFATGTPDPAAANFPHYSTGGSGGANNPVPLQNGSPNWFQALSVEMDNQPVWDMIVRCLTAETNTTCQDQCDGKAYTLDTAQQGKFVITPICPVAPKMTLKFGGENSGSNNKYGLENMLKGNYAANYGANDYHSYRNDIAVTNRLGLAGVFEPVLAPQFTSSLKARLGQGLGTTTSMITDGKSSTVLASEVVGYNSFADGRGAAWSYMMGGAAFSGRLQPNGGPSASPTTAGKDVIPACDSTIPTSNRLSCTELTSTGRGVFAAARSGHADGVNVAMCEATTRFVKNDIDLYAWQSMLTRAGSDIIRQQ